MINKNFTFFTLVLITALISSCHKYDNNNPIENEKFNESVPISENGILEIGDYYKGGVVFYIDETNEHGMVCALKDEEAKIWGCEGTDIIGADDLTLGSGLQNSIDINSQCDTIHAARTCLNKAGEYEDWFLPNIAELYYMSINADIINKTASYYGGGSFYGDPYWSSNEIDDEHAYIFMIVNGFKASNFKSEYCNIRAVRKF